MKTLILVRHGKSSWDHNVSDRDRPLLEKGVQDAVLVATALKEQHLEIDAAFSSPANRALHTSMVFLRKLDFPLRNFRVTDQLYDFSGDEVLQFIKEMDNSLKTVLIFGHNHAFTHIANSLGNSYLDNLPTSGLVTLHFNIATWEEISKGSTGQTILPKRLKG